MVFTHWDFRFAFVYKYGRNSDPTYTKLNLWLAHLVFRRTLNADGTEFQTSETLMTSSSLILVVIDERSPGLSNGQRGELRSPFEDYGATYHQRLVALVVDLPTNLQVPFAEHHEFISGTSIRSSSSLER